MLYFLQFPSPFPNFENAVQVREDAPEKRVSFVPDVKTTATDENEIGIGVGASENSLDSHSGEVGRLEVHRSGKIKIRFGEKIVYDVSMLIGIEDKTDCFR